MISGLCSRVNNIPIELVHSDPENILGLAPRRAGEIELDKP